MTTHARAIGATLLLVAACGADGRAASTDDSGPDAASDATPAFGDSAPPPAACDAACSSTEVCLHGACVDACDAANEEKSSVGCDYFAVHMDIENSTLNDNCFATMVANTSPTPAKLNVSFQGQSIDLAKSARIPQGAGKSLTYAPFDPSVGIPPGQVAIVFLADDLTPPIGYDERCPAPAAVSYKTFPHGTGRTSAFHIRTDVPVVAYQMLPYGGGEAAVTGASLLIPTSAWDTNYVAMDAYPISSMTLSAEHPAEVAGPSLSIVAEEDQTSITVLPKTPVEGGPGVSGAPANQPVVYELDAGDVLQLTQIQELTGSPIQSDKPIGFFAGSTCMFIPQNTYWCDHGEQQIPGVRALGSEYAVVSYRQRTVAPESPPNRFVGVVDGTELTYDPPIPGAPASLDLGEVVEFDTGTPFVVRSQDAQHPFIAATYMTGSVNISKDGYGDPDFVRVVPPAQYSNRYVFFTDPTYPETDLVFTRKRGANGFSDVTLDCAGTISGWQNIGSGEYQYTRVDLVRHDWQPQGNCDNGRHEATSSGVFGLWVWGWGSVETGDWGSFDFTQNVSYGYPAGEGLSPINSVVVPPNPK